MPKKSKPRLDVEEEPMLSGMATSSGPGTNGFIANGSMGAAAFGSLPDIQAIAERGPRARPVIHSSQSLGEVELGRTDTAGQASDTEQGEGSVPPDPLPPPLLKLVEYQPPQRTATYTAWRYIMYICVIGPWKLVRGLGWLLNRWQRVFRPVSAALHFTNDHLDKYMPTVLNVFTWAWGTLSLFLHFIAVFTTAAIALVLHHNGHRVFAAAIACLYLLSHYLMAVIMYMEQDRVARAGRYNLSEFSVFAQRLVDVALYDIQLLASLVHSNTMIEGLTQMLLKGYEEARVCVHMLVNTLPMCVMLGVLYDGVVLQWIEFEDLDIQSYQQQIWIALVFSVLNALEKWLRLSLADPWLHPRNDDRYPLLYMRSNASRLPRGLMMDWLFRCNTQLQRHDDHLVLREVFAVYVFNCKGDARELCDGHKAYLLKKALRTFNSVNTFNRAETVARRLAKTKLPDSRSIQYLDASNIRPGRYMSSMLGEVLGDSSGYEALNLADNFLGDESVAQIMEGLRGNKLLELHTLILAGNDIGQLGCQLVATYLAANSQLQVLDLSHNPLRDAGAKALAEVLCQNRVLSRLDLSHSGLGPEAGAALGHMLKSNLGLRELDLSHTQLGNTGVESLSRGLKANTTLRSLNVSRTGAEDKAAVGLAQALVGNRQLTRLDLSHTRVGDAGAKALCDALQVNPVLQVCDLTGSSVDKSWLKLVANIITGRSKSGGHK